MRSPILVPALSDLLIKVHVLGYRTMGESIVVVFISASTRKVLYSMVIDSFERKDENKNLLNRTSIFDFFGSKTMCTSHKGNARQLHT